MFSSYAPLINNDKKNPCRSVPNDIYTAFVIVHKELIMSLIFFFMLKEKKKAW